MLNEDTSDPLECLEPSPQTDFSWDESTRSQFSSQRVSDDVNGLSLALDSKSSFLGISSISAILRVMAYIAPDFHNSIWSEALMIIGIHEYNRYIYKYLYLFIKFKDFTIKSRVL